MAKQTDSTEPADVLRAAEPLTRESLSDEAVVTALWEFAAEDHRTGAASVFECARVYRAFDHTLAHRYEIATALDYYGVTEVPEKRISAAFRQRLQ